ncbi:MAG: glucose-6-phosphate isomerase [Patescibacteria group bacterium]
MLQLNLDNLEKIKQKNASTILSKLDSNVSDYELIIEAIRQQNYGFLKLPDQIAQAGEFTEFAKSVKDKYEYLVLIGIGGSSLGPKCLWQTLGNRSKLKIKILDNLDPVDVSNLENSINLDKTLFLIISKSGNTPETVVEYLYFKQKIQALNLSVKDHFIFITDPVKGFLRQEGVDLEVKTFDLPTDVGGRFSVLSSVGLVFGALLELNLNELLGGAAAVRDAFFATQNETDNLAFSLASLQYQLSLNGVNINFLMPYSSRLKSFSEWYVQLLSESIGKAKNRAGELVNVGITPVSAIGVTDQHSMLQLLQEGPIDKLIIFIKPTDINVSLAIPNSDAADLQYLQGKSINQLFEAEFEGTRQSLTEAEKPNVTIQTDQVNEQSLGELFMLFELSIAVLGELYDIDAFDQPGVELSKKLARQNLANTD